MGIGILFVKRGLVEMLSFQYNNDESADLLLLGHEIHCKRTSHIYVVNLLFLRAMLVTKIAVNAVAH